MVHVSLRACIYSSLRYRRLSHRTFFFLPWAKTLLSSTFFGRVIRIENAFFFFFLMYAIYASNKQLKSQIKFWIPVKPLGFLEGLCFSWRPLFIYLFQNYLFISELFPSVLAHMDIRACSALARFTSWMIVYETMVLGRLQWKPFPNLLVVQALELFWCFKRCVDRMGTQEAFR